MAEGNATSASKPRLEWIDAIKGLSILWIAFFHCFGTYVHDQLPSPTGPAYYQRYLEHCGATDWIGSISCGVEATAVAFARLGYHAVAVFLLLSGFGLAFTLSGPPAQGWGSWYRRRLLRLFPMYWVAHLIYLVSPFVARPEPIDYRFLLSAVGDRIYPVYTIFYYANPAWWYFGLLLQLYLIFPVLFRLLQRLGTGRFLVLCGVATVVTRYVILNVYPLPGAYVQGAFFASRLWEFAAGMALGAAARSTPAVITTHLFRPEIFLLGILLYGAGLYSYASMTTYALTDALIGTGLFIMLAHVARALVRFGIAAPLATVGLYSYGLYLIHQPYVTYFGERLRGADIITFLAVAVCVIGALVMTCIPLERVVNRVVDAMFARAAVPRTVEERTAVSR